MNRIIEPTQTMRPGMRGADWEQAKTAERDGWNAGTLHLYSHAGTHMDAQTHFAVGPGTMRGNRLVFLSVTYNDNYPYIPETVSNGTSYTNTLTSICLSLLEQRDLFEGRLAHLPAVSDADRLKIDLRQTFPP